ncbi:MAG: SpoIIE family protein phosphatase [Eubacteriales bacterium]|nr:SpoIIE family protein phosphatase [Eubacteriales bacterium]MDY3286066.1 SpoIIE family protein phosphatase [Eubacteriales bacterium]
MEQEKVKREAAAPGTLVSAAVRFRELGKKLRASEALTIASVYVMDAAAGALLARGIILVRYAPLGAAYAAACACGRLPGKLHGKAARLAPFAAVFGSILGYCTLSQADPLRYACACVILLAAGIVFRDSPVAENRWFLPASALFAMVSTGAAFAMTGGGSETAGAWGNFLLYVCEGLLCAGAAFFYDIFRRSMRPWNEWNILTRQIGGRLGRWEISRTEKAPALSQRAAILIAGASFCMVLRLFAPFFGIRWGHVLAMLGVLSSACAGALPAAAAGLCLGGAMDLASLSAPAFAAIYGLCGLFCGIYRKRSSFAVALAFVAANAASLAWQAEPQPALFEGFAASVLFLLFSGKLAAFGGLLFPSAGAVIGIPQKAEQEGARGYLRTRVDELAAAFAALGEMCAAGADERETRGEPAGMAWIPSPPSAGGMDGSGGNAPNLSAFNVAVERTCKSCSIRDVCWSREYSGTRNALTDASAKVLAHGRAEASDFPPYFAARCVRLPDFLANLNEAVARTSAAASYQKRFRRRVREDTRLLAAQYDGMTRVLGELMDEFQSIPEPLPAKSAALAAELARAGASPQSVDVYRAPSGRLTARVVLAPDSAAPEPVVLLAASRVLGRTMIASPAAAPADDAEEGARPRVLPLREREPLRAVVGIALRAKNGETQSGDAGTYFKTPSGLLCLLISDGMGAGPQAARQSATLARLLESFLRAGIRPATALRLVCPAFAIRSDGENFASVDLLCVDLYTGDASFYKCGAAPSFVWQDGGPVKKIVSNALPAGLFAPGAAGAERTALSLRGGDVVAMVSDGVLSTEEEAAAFSALLAKRSAAGAGELASLLLGAAKNHADDATVLVCKLSDRT